MFSDEVMLRHHLQFNHFPPLPEAMVAIAQWAIERGQSACTYWAEDYAEWDDDVLNEERAMPSGIEFRGRASITVGEAIKSMHLDQIVQANVAEEWAGTEEVFDD